MSSVIMNIEQQFRAYTLYFFSSSHVLIWVSTGYSYSTLLSLSAYFSCCYCCRVKRLMKLASFVKAVSFASWINGRAGWWGPGAWYWTNYHYKVFFSIFSLHSRSNLSLALWHISTCLSKNQEANVCIYMYV